MCRRQRSKLFKLTESPEVLTELLYSGVNWDLAFRHESLKRKLAHFGKTARLRERQAFLLEERQRQFLL